MWAFNTVTNPTELNPEPKDDVYDYPCGFMNMALLLRNFAYGTKEGDGKRIIRCIKLFLASTKYSLEALNDLFQVFALLSPREAERLIWNRTVNNKGRSGCNVAMDLVLEHDNHLVRERIRSLGANISQESVCRICRAFFVLKSFLQCFDKELKVKKISGDHSKKSAKEDLKKVIKTL